MPRLPVVKRIKLLSMAGLTLLVKLKPFVPFSESLSTIAVQLVCVAEKVFTGVRNRLIEFTIIIIVFPTDPRPVLVYAADSIGLQMLAIRLNVQKPAIAVFEDVDIVV